jgi:hypothetical protein
MADPASLQAGISTYSLPKITFHFERDLDPGATVFELVDPSAYSYHE